MKKSVTIITLLSTIIFLKGIINFVEGDNYSEEFYNAYDFAYKNGITTIDNIDKAKMNSPLTRIAMAKMLSNYAINVLGKKPDTSKGTKNYNDITSKQNTEYSNAVTLSYQLGIMGQGTNNFRPNDEVTRAEFASALSRMLYSTPDGNDKYYTTHLTKLKQEGIISNDNPNIKEKRGYVMLMLMRSQNNGITTNENNSNISQNNENYKVTDDENYLTKDEVKKNIEKDKMILEGNIIYGKNGNQDIYGANTVYINTGYGITFTLSGDELNGGILNEHDSEEYDEKIGDIRKEHIILFENFDETGYFLNHYRISFFITSLPNEQYDKLIQTPEGKFEWENGKIGRNNKYTFTVFPVNELHINNWKIFDLED